MSRNAYPKYKPSGVEWLGEIPGHWRTLRLKYTSSMNDEVLPENTNPDHEIQYVDISSVDAVEGIKKKDIMRFEEAPSRARRRVRDGDVIVSTVRTYLRAIAPINNSEENLIVSTGFAVIRPKRDVNSNFAAYALRAPYFVEAVVARSVGVSYPAINAGEIGTLRIAIPPVGEQRTIASFLDRETVRIDRLMEKKQRQIDLLQEKRAALISHTVTKGLDPSAPMKDSEVEWLGQIPAHWKVKKVKFLAKILRGKFSHRPRNDPQLYDGPYPFIQTGDIVSANKFINEYQQTLNELGFAVSKEFPKGTLVMSIAANIGDLAILEFPACFPDSIVGFFPKAQVDLNYLYYNLESMKQELKITAPLNTQQNLNIERIGPLQTVSPPINEQRRIAVFLDQETAKIEGLIAKIQESLDKLKEYRTALISAAVTGQIDVREEAA